MLSAKTRLLCAALKKSVNCSVATLEAMAIFDGLKLALRMGATLIIIESDAEIVIKSLNMKGKDFSSFGQVVEASLKFTRNFSNIYIFF